MICRSGDRAGVGSYREWGAIFQGIHAELHRRFKAQRDHLIRVEQYGAVLVFLEE